MIANTSRKAALRISVASCYSNQNFKTIVCAGTDSPDVSNMFRFRAARAVALNNGAPRRKTISGMLISTPLKPRS